ncbi:MAG: sugar kinase [Lentimonas sp.]
MKEAKQSEVVTLGEVLLRMSVQSGTRIQTLSGFDAHPAGAEANVAANLARLGVSTAFLTALRDHPIARGIEDQLKQAGVNTSRIDWREEGRMGAFFVEYAAPPRPIQVIYDRSESCASKMNLEDFDMGLIQGAKLIHLSGITPALSKQNTELTRYLIDAAKKNEVLISFDVNFRAKIWSPKEACDILTPFIGEADILFCSQRDARTIWGIDKEGSELLDALGDFTSAAHVVSTFGERGAACKANGRFYSESALPVEIVDRLGAGDALVAGYLYGLLTDQNEQALKYGVTMAALALSQFGDFVQTNPQELKSLAEAQADYQVNR